MYMYIYIYIIYIYLENQIPSFFWVKKKNIGFFEKNRLFDFTHNGLMLVIH